MKALVAICIAILFVLPGCTKTVVKENKEKTKQAKEEETPAWAKFPMQDDGAKDEEDE